MFAHINGGQEQVAISVPPAGQQLVSLQSGRKAHFWWPVDQLAGTDEEGFRVLRYVVPNMDLIIVGRETPVGWQVVFKGAVVECGYDGQTVSVTALEHAQPKPPQGPPPGGVREPVVPGDGGGPQRLAETLPPPSPEVRSQLGDFFRQGTPGQDAAGRQEPVGAVS